MKNKIAILGSTGSIGFTTLKIIKKDKKNFEIKLLSTNDNAKKIFKQAKEFNVKNVIIINPIKFNSWKSKFKKNKIKIYNNFTCINKIFKKKIDYSINAISGVDGLNPTLKIIKFSKRIAIANKESIICGWNLISKELKKYKTQFIPVDSEHFSIYQLIKNQNPSLIKKIVLTASGGPFFNRKQKKKISVQDALKHPNWKMGKKITIDSSTLVNKVFEVIEAKKIFNLKMKDISILVNQNSYIHAIVLFKNGIIKLLAHETKMDIPISNSIYEASTENKINSKDLNINKINNINLTRPEINQFKVLKILKLIPSKDSLFETVLITVNDELVDLFLNRKIEYKMISALLLKIINFKNLKKYCKVKPISIEQIYKTRNYVKRVVKTYVSKSY